MGQLTVPTVLTTALNTTTWKLRLRLQQFRVAFFLRSEMRKIKENEGFILDLMDTPPKHCNVTFILCKSMQAKQSTYLFGHDLGRALAKSAQTGKFTHTTTLHYKPTNQKEPGHTSIYNTLLI